MTHEQAVEWMVKHGHPNYAIRINNAKCVKDEIIGEAGRYWQHCSFTQEAIKKIDEEIAEIARDAWERYEDWATD